MSISYTLSRKANFLKVIKRKTYNPFEILLYRIGLKKNLIIKTKSSINFKIPKEDEIKNNKWSSFDLFQFLITCIDNSYHLNESRINNLLNQFKSLNESFNFEELNFLNESSSGIIAESINGNEYIDILNLENSDEKIILDIGANIGDSPLFFAKYYKKVYAFEPVPYNYEKMRQNIELNPQYKDKIVTYNNAVSDKIGTLKISIDGAESSVYTNGRDYCEIDAVRIPDILNDINDKDHLILKMDCEGAEFDIVLNEDLSMFDEIIMECHSQVAGKNKEVIGDKLISEGFNVNYFPAGFEEDIDKMSHIYAYKN